MSTLRINDSPKWAGANISSDESLFARQGEVLVVNQRQVKLAVLFSAKNLC